MKRLMRLRQNQWVRELCNEIEFNSAQLVQPYFIAEGLQSPEAVPGLGVENSRWPKDMILKQIEKDIRRGVRHALLFFVPQHKSAQDFNFSFQREVIGAIKKQFGSELMLWIDTCLCSLTTHGHCAILNEQNNTDLDKTLKTLANMAKIYAEAGADGISPSDMMDGRVKEIREHLDENGFSLTPIMSYSTKFASYFYGPFRQAADSAPQFGDRRCYQIDVRARADALLASDRCAQEGADLLMVKPGMPSMDLIRPIHERTRLLVGAYQVSGEYAGILLASEAGLLDYRGALRESWLVLKRAGSQYIITYGAREAELMGVKIV